MKKLLAVSFCTTLALGFASSAFAIHMTQPEDTSAVVAKGGLITMDGNIRMRGWAQRDTDKAKNAEGDRTARDTQGYDGRARIGLTAKTSDAVTGRILLENETDRGYEGNWVWGLENSSNFDKKGTGVLHNGGATHRGPEFLEAWIQYVPSNWGVKVGHMPLALGNKLFFDHTLLGDDALVAFINPNEQTHIAALAIKFVEGPTNIDKVDVDGYVGLATYKANEAANLGIWYTYLNEGKHSQAALPGLSMSNLGLTLDGTMSNISYKLNYEGQFGDIINDPLHSPLKPRLKAKGYAFMGEASMAVDTFNIGALIGYGSGDKDTTDDKNKAFLNFLGQTRYQSTMVGYRLPVPDASGNLGPMSGNLNTGLSNLFLVQVNGSTDVTCPVSGKDLNLMARLNWMKLNEKAAGESDKIGTEVELFATWALDNGLSFGFEGAYLFAGSAYENVTSEYTGLNVDKENAWFARTFLELAF